MRRRTTSSEVTGAPQGAGGTPRRMLGRLLPLAVLLPMVVIGGVLLTRGGGEPARSGSDEGLAAAMAPMKMAAPRAVPAETPSVPADSTALPSESGPPSASPSPSEGAGAPGQTELTEPTKVQVGFYLNKIQGLDLAENTYTVDFYLWLRWTGDTDVSTTLDFVNEDAKAFPRSRPFFDEPQELPDGGKYQGWHVLSTFKSLFDFSKYPRDRHVLPIDVEDNTYDVGSVVYSLAADGVQYDTSAKNVIGGWTMGRKPWATIGRSEYKSNFGDPEATTRSTSYSHLTINLELSRPAGGYLAKSIIPITIVILMTMLTFLVGDDLNSRLAMSITALISAVVLHSESTRELPTIGYFVLFDWVYILAYLAIFGALVQSLVAHKVRSSGKPELSRRLDLWVGVAVTAAYVGGVALVALA